MFLTAVLVWETDDARRAQDLRLVSRARLDQAGKLALLYVVQGIPRSGAVSDSKNKIYDRGISSDK